MVLMEKSEGNRLFARPRHRPENNIRMDAKNTGWRVWTAVHLAKARDKRLAVVNTGMSLKLVHISPYSYVSTNQ
jgi:hypothetical protein